MIKLSEISTDAPEGLTKKNCLKDRDKMTRRIGALQHIMYAEEKHSLLVVFQGMDASGKDGATRNGGGTNSTSNMASRSSSHWNS